jgi:hypothetical protein
MSNDKNVWQAMSDLSEKMLLDRVNPNKTLVEEALSFDAYSLDTISDIMLRKYIVALGQYLISLQFEENKAVSVCAAWSKSLDSYIFNFIQHSSVPSNVKTLAEKRAWVLENDEQAKSLDDEFQVAESKRAIISSMCRPVDAYINTLKKEIDARENEKKRINQ